MPHSVQELIKTINVKDPIDSAIKLQKIRQAGGELSAKSEALLVKLLTPPPIREVQHEILATLKGCPTLSEETIETILKLTETASTVILFDTYQLLKKLPGYKNLDAYKKLWLRDALSDVQGDYLQFFLHVNSPQFPPAEQDRYQFRIQLNLYYFLSAPTPDIRYAVVKYLLENSALTISHCARIVPALGPVLLEKLVATSSTAPLIRELITNWYEKTGDLLQFALELDARTKA